MKPSIPLSGFTTTVPPPLFRLPQSHCLFLRRFRQTSPVKLNISGCSFPINNHSSRPLTVDNSQNQQPPPRRTLFPGGFKRAEIKVPSLVLRLDADEILSSEEGDLLALVDRAVADAVGIVVLDGGAGGSSGGGKLYEAACLLKSVVKDRAYLMIAERVDIAAAVGASGVVLSDQGLPAIVARNSMISSKTESVILPLVGKIVRSKDDALSASNLEGADFLIYDAGEHSEGSFGVSSVLEGVKIPVFTMFSTYGREARAAVATSQLGAGGLVVSLEDVRLLGAGALSQLLNGTHPLNSERQDQIDSFPNGKLLDSEHYLQEKRGLAGIKKLKNKEKQLIEAEKSLLHEAIKVIQKAAPLMEEISLLIDAVSRIDEPFLLVIVGEFNSGKSTVINSLLGKRYLNEGVIPTTNEITFLRFSELESEDQQRCERHPDGQFICYLPAPILKDMTIVDTPGTNVILQRQQRLTEEFIPRADLLLFVISADRPLTESEVSFLRYTQQWKKKIVFVLNKSDIYRNAYELEEAVSFIKENTRNLLNSENVTLFPISARSALEAKLSDASSVGKDDSEFLEPTSHLKTHSFQELERFLYDFLDGSTSMGMERIKLKLQTPTAITERLLSASESLVEQETHYAKQDLASANRMINSINEYTIRMENESIAWRRKALSLIDVMKSRAIEVIESTIRISNLDIVTSYILKGEKSSRTSASSRFQIDILAPALLNVEKLLKEYAIWLKSNNTREGRLLVESFENKWPAIVQTKAQAHLETYEFLKEIDEHSLRVIQDLSASSTSNLLEKEIQEVFMETFSGLGVAGVSASLLTSVLPTTLEDLLALGLCSAGGYIAISRFPGRKRAIIDKVNKTADALALQLEDAMQKDLASTISSLEKFVKFIAKPYQEEAEGRLEKLSGIQSELSDVTKQLQILQVDIQNLHVL